MTIRLTTPQVRPISEGPVVFQDKPILVRGHDRYGHFSYELKPSFAATPSSNPSVGT